MLQYLLNATAIWLVSLVIFDLFLSRESYHGYNRFYLLFTFLLGVVLPLWHLDDNTTTQAISLSKPVQQVLVAKQTIIASAPVETTINWQQYLLIIYLTGVFVALCLLIFEIIKLTAVFRSDNKSVQNGWKIIETGKGHAPFSFSNTLFINSRQQYNDEEWDMILRHEKRHALLFHVADLLLMQIARIVFWFHPLVYLYNKRLLLIHEYQADNAPVQQPQVYGKFLVEQAILQSAPALSHSLNRSPIKSRILMLTHKSSVTEKIKMLVFIPLVFICIICFSQNGFSNKPKKHGNMLTYNGNTIEFLAPKEPSSYLYKDEVTGKTHREPISWPTPPIKLNGEKIYDATVDKGVINPSLNSTYNSLAAYILGNAQNEFKTLEDGNYFILIDKVIIDAKGRVVYFENEGVFHDGANMDNQLKQKKIIDKKIDKLLEAAPTLDPARINGTPVVFLINGLFPFTFGYKSSPDFTIKDHKVTWDERMGEQK